MIDGATVLDGTGAAAFVAGVAIKGDTIAAIGDVAAGQAASVVDARGLHVSPGFVDIHSHSDGSVLRYPGNESRVRQGITTEITGNCGSSAAPILGQALESERRDAAAEGESVGWSDVASYFARLEQALLTVNQALLVGQGTLRTGVVGPSDRPATPGEMALMARTLEAAFDQPAVVRRTKARDSAVKRALLDQGLVSGIGNIYADEALWRAGVHGERLCSALTRPTLARVLDHARDVMLEALDQGGTSFDALYVNVNGASGYFDRSLAAYGQEGRPCPWCGAPIRREAFMNRSSYSCPRCQPRPRRRSG